MQRALHLKLVNLFNLINKVLIGIILLYNRVSLKGRVADYINVEERKMTRKNQKPKTSSRRIIFDK